MESLIQQCQQIHPLERAAEQALQGICTLVSFPKSATVQPIGHTCKTIYFVEHGALRIHYFKEDVDVTESFEFENAFVARAESLFTGKPSKKAIETLEDTRLVAIDARKWFALFSQHHDLETLFRKIIERSYVATINRIENLQFHTAEERYAMLLKERADVLQRVPLKFIASYLGITAVSLSRIRAIK